MPFPDLPPDRIPGSPGHLNDHQLIDQALDYVQQQAYRDDPDFPPLPDIPVLGQSGHVTAHDRILAVLEYVKNHPLTVGAAVVGNNPTGTYSAGGNNYAYYRFTSSGTLSVTAEGYLDYLIVSGGAGGSSSVAPGQGGWTSGSVKLSAGTYSVGVGAGGAQNGTSSSSPGYPSHLGTITSSWTGWGRQSGGGSAPGITSSITGKSVTYGQGNVTNPQNGTGDGGAPGSRGASGVVIIRTQLN